ncbi:hypothetical protein T439DRAFT_93333 [Meredithblackwellia eburnea MCA 4105]
MTDESSKPFVCDIQGCYSRFPTAKLLQQHKRTVKEKAHQEAHAERKCLRNQVKEKKKFEKRAQDEAKQARKKEREESDKRIKECSQGEDPLTTCGEIFSKPYRRAIKSQTLLYIELGRLRAETEGQKRAFTHAEMEKMANEILADCVSYHLPKDGPIYTAFQTYPTIRANKSLGLIQHQISVDKKNHVTSAAAIWHDEKAARLGSAYYYKAAQLMSDDCIDKSWSLYRSLSLGLRGGGMTMGEVLKRGEAAEAAFEPPKLFFGGTTRTFEDRTFTRGQLSTIRDWLETDEAGTCRDRQGKIVQNKLDITLKPIGTVFTKTLRPGQHPTEGVDQSIVLRQPGLIGLMEMINSPYREWS